jgi:hypothetical protein
MADVQTSEVVTILDQSAWDHGILYVENLQRMDNFSETIFVKTKNTSVEGG